MKLHPQDVVAIVSVAWDICTGVPLLLIGQTLIAALVLMGGVVIVIGADLYEDRFYRRGGKISWLDFMQIRDLMSHGNNFEAIRFTMKRAFDMDDEEILALKPEDFSTLMNKLRIEQQNGES
jgi:hypothetical protein